jgi:hypothetical protein
MKTKPIDKLICLLEMAEGVFCDEICCRADLRKITPEQRDRLRLLVDNLGSFLRDVDELAPRP